MKQFPIHVHSRFYADTKCEIISILQSDLITNFISDFGIAFMLDPNFDSIEAKLTHPDFLVLDL